MISSIRKHLGYYITFTAVQLLGLLLVILAAGNRQVQQIAILGTAIFYFVFAIIHHMLDHDLTPKIVIEYALIGCLGLAGALVAFNHI